MTKIVKHFLNKNNNKHIIPNIRHTITKIKSNNNQQTQIINKEQIRNKI